MSNISLVMTVMISWQPWFFDIAKMWHKIFTNLNCLIFNQLNQKLCCTLLFIPPVWYSHHPPEIHVPAVMLYSGRPHVACRHWALWLTFDALPPLPWPLPWNKRKIKAALSRAGGGAVLVSKWDTFSLGWLWRSGGLLRLPSPWAGSLVGRADGDISE